MKFRLFALVIALAFLSSYAFAHRKHFHVSYNGHDLFPDHETTVPIFDTLEPEPGAERNQWRRDKAAVHEERKSWLGHLIDDHESNWDVIGDLYESAKDLGSTDLADLHSNTHGSRDGHLHHAKIPENSERAHHGPDDLIDHSMHAVSHGLGDYRHYVPTHDGNRHGHSAAPAKPKLSKTRSITLTWASLKKAN